MAALSPFTLECSQANVAPGAECKDTKDWVREKKEEGEATS